MNRKSFLFAICLLLSSLFLFFIEPSTAQLTQAKADLFDLVGTAQPSSSVSIAGVREQEIKINFDKIDFAAAHELVFPLLNGNSYKATRREVEGFIRFGDDEFTWRGKIFGENDWTGDVILSVKGKALSGLIYSPGAVYEIVPQANFKHVLIEIDQSRFPACGGSVKPTAQPKQNEEVSAPQISLDDGSLIDVMVVYTAAVRTALGGTTQSQAFAQQAISTTNTVYQNSGISTRLRLVHTLEVNYADNGTGRDGLDWVTADATVAAARNTAKADMVALLTENANDICGIAWIMTNVGPSFASRAFSLTQRTCAIGGLTFPHELGHNQACDHNPENATLSASELAYPYAFGHWNSGADFRTVMSYSNPCPSCSRIPYFSNPGITHNGVAIGIANQRDNSRVINNTALTISQFRDSGGTSCSYSLNPASRNFTAASNSSSVGVTTGSGCAWTATVNAPSTPETAANEQESQPTAGRDSAPQATAPTALFLNSTPMTINDRSSSTTPPGTSSVYPSTINVSGMSGTITQVQAALNGVTHSFPDDLDVVLVGPGGQRVLLMSDAGGGGDISGVNLTFEQTATAMPDGGQLASATYRPTNFGGNTTIEPGGVDNFPSPGPGQSNYSSDLTIFNGTAANGAWQLYIVDDESVDTGNIATGWALSILTSTGGSSWINITSGSSGTGNGTVNYSVAANTGTSQRTGTITVNGQTHTVTQAGTSTNVQVTVSTAPSGRSFTVDGTSYTSAQTFQWTSGASHTIATTSLQNGATGTRYIWDNWSDGGGISHSVAPTSNTNYTTNFTTQYFLTMSAGTGGSVSPVSNWFNSGQAFQITATPNGGFNFSGWTGSGTGSVSGSANPATVTMSGPITETANFSQVAASSARTIGLYNPAAGAFFLRNANSTGVADVTFNYGPGGAGWLPLAGDWNGNAVVTTGLYNPASSTFFLRNTNSTGIADVTFGYGPGGAGWLPLAGDWNGDGLITVGLYNPASGTFFLRNSNSTGVADITFAYGPGGAGWLPIVGDWNGDGIETVGLYNPATGTFFLRNSNSTGVADVTFAYGPGGAGWLPLAGDWNGDGTDTAGLYNPANGTFFLRNSNSTGVADVTFAYGPGGAGWRPLVGDWNGL